MAAWKDRRLLDLLGIDLPVIQAPMAGANGIEMVIAVGQAGGLGSLPCALLSPAQVLEAARQIRERTRAPFNLNFFCHAAPDLNDPAVQARLADWRRHLTPFYEAAGLAADTPFPLSGRAPFDDAYCRAVEEVRPAVVSFHFGLPAPALLARVKATGAKILSSATTVAEARWLAERGVDAVIATGAEAGGHRASFLQMDMSRQVGAFALAPQIADAVSVPVIAAGGISDGRGVAAALVLGASAVQVGTAYLLTDEATISEAHRAALLTTTDDGTQITNIFTGRPARGIINQAMRDLGPLSPLAPDFPLAGGALTPLKSSAALNGAAEFSNLWAGQAAALARRTDAASLTKALAAEALARLHGSLQNP
ncbi:nitronate monooxygenase [Asticcacaulis sp.]|uniref:NAD(P)H-dependent flavin oxidoreductase n=1 Tax=Asticcacaulis sp. TaxID=1872648 RepID=UPI002C1D6AD2|nr:nitronate monooxygenase [Asticcacaulis sp.]HTM80848.1 nitronate monooxygenase [Asticcacaulis sp.]